jgi:hypothetical protein
MPSVIEKIVDVLTQSNVDVLINVQVGQLGTAQVSFRQFATNAKAEIKSFIDGISSIPLPADLHAQTLEDSFNTYLDAFPQQLSGVSVELSEKSEEIISHINATYVTPLENFFELYRCIDEILLRMGGVGFAGNSAPQDTAPFASVKLMLSKSLKEGLKELSDALDEIETPLTGVESMMVLLGVFISFIPREYFSTAQSPFIEEIRRLLETAQTWEDLAASDLAAKILAETEEIRDFLKGIFEDVEIEALIVAAEQAADTLKVAYDANNPSQDISDIIQNLDKLAIGITGYAETSSPNHATALDEVNQALDQLPQSVGDLKAKLQNISTDFFDSKADDDLAQALEDLTDQLEEKMTDAFNRLMASYELDLVPLFPETFAAKEIDLDFDEMLETVKETLDWLCNLIEKLNIAEAAVHFNTAAADMSQKLDDWNTAVDSFMTEINDRLQNLESEIDQIDTAEIEEEIKDAINAYKEAIQDEVIWILSKIETEIDKFVALVETTADNYSHQDLEDSLNDFIQSIAEILMEYMERLDQVKSSLSAAGEKLKNLSFKAVSDLIVEQIDKATDDLKAIDPDKLNGGVRLALTVALDVLPTDELLLKRMDKLKDELDELIESGPVRLIEKYKDKPDELLEKIMEKSPAPLVKAKLGELYGQLVKVLEGFKPGDIVNPIDDKLSEIDAAIEKMDNPCKIFDSVVVLYEKLLLALDRFDREAVLDYLEDQKEKLKEAIDEVAPPEMIDDIIERLEELAEAPGELQTVLEKVRDITAHFDNPEQKIDQWLQDRFYDKIDDLFALSGFGTDLVDLIDEVSDEADDFSNNEVQLRVTAKVYALLAVIQALDPQDQLSNLLLAYNNVKASPIEELPEPERTNVQDFLNDFSPFDPVIVANLEAFQSLKDKLEAHYKRLTDWKHLFFGPHSPLNSCVPTADTLKDCVEAAFKPPLMALLSSMPQIKTFIEELTAILDEFITDCLPDISGFSAGLAGIKNNWQFVADELQNIDLSVAYNLDAIYAAVQSKLNDLDVKGLQTAVCEAFDDLRDNLKVSQIISENDIESLEKSYAKLLEVAQAFDPVKWVEETVEPEFIRLLEPYLEPFDLTKFFEDLLERLDVLKKEIREELDRIFREFMEMLAAVPRMEGSAQIQIAI